MSLLMQALKKAERSKQNSLLDDEGPDKPSEAYDEVLALTPQDLAPGRFPPKPVEFSLEPIDEPGLAALDVPCMPEESLEQIPVLMPAEEAPHDPTPPQSRLGGAHKHGHGAQPQLEPMPPHAPQPRTGLSELSLQDVPPELVPRLGPEQAFAPHASWSKDVAPALQSEAIAPTLAPGGIGALSAPPPEVMRATLATTTAPATPAAPAGMEARTGNRRQGSGQRATDASASGAAMTDRPTEQRHSQAGPAIAEATAAKPGAAARARAAAEARAAAAEDKVGRDPARIRLAVLSGVLLLIVALFGYLYWRATTAPGPGASLPMVPMPPPDTGGAKQGVIVAPPAGSQPGPDGGADAGAGAGGLAGSGAAGTGAGGVAGTGAAMPGTAAGHSAPYGSAAGNSNPAGGPSADAPGSVAAPSLARGPAPGSQAAPAGAANTVMASPDEIERAMQMQGGQQGVQQGVPGAGGPGAAGAGWAGGPGYGAGAGAGAAGSGAGAGAGRRAESAWSSKDIKVSHSTSAPRVSPALESGYRSLLAGDFPAAAEHYGAALRQDPNNRDALLGNAAVAVRRNDAAQASASYLRLLELNPGDPDAVAGLLSLRPGDTGQSELRLKDLLRKAPDSAPLQFALGNLYARQSRWTDAQQAYFRAYSASPDNPDYAFNLAVGLDRLNQPRLALNYYQRALSLAQAGPAGFDSEAVRARMRQLAESH